MKDYNTAQAMIINEIEEYRKSGESDRQILYIELEGIYAILFRAICRLADENKEKNEIQSAVRGGILLKAKDTLAKAGIIFNI